MGMLPAAQDCCIHLLLSLPTCHVQPLVLDAQVRHVLPHVHTLDGLHAAECLVHVAHSQVVAEVKEGSLGGGIGILTGNDTEEIVDAVRLTKHLSA